MPSCRCMVFETRTRTAYIKDWSGFRIRMPEGLWDMHVGQEVQQQHLSSFCLSRQSLMAATIGLYWSPYCINLSVTEFWSSREELLALWDGRRFVAVLTFNYTMLFSYTMFWQHSQCFRLVPHAYAHNAFQLWYPNQFGHRRRTWCVADPFY